MNSNGYPTQPRLPSDGPSYSPRGSAPLSQSSASQSAALSRAERFEDEKRRLIETCFSKVDANGQLSESYITHIRIEEDAVFPQSPPPPNADPKNKKPRIVVIAVRSSGRVRMHKARENNNASFSIGKTWNLEDLTAIESYTLPDPNQDPRREQLREWAGPVGFTVTIAKPYYWQAGSSKEKDFFIASLVKIYRKYTKGQIPALNGFTEREMETILGLLPGQQPPPRLQPDPKLAPPMQRPSIASDNSRSGSNDARGPPQRAMSRDKPQPSPDFFDSAARRQASQEPPSRAPQRQDLSTQPPEQLQHPRQYAQAPSRERLAQSTTNQFRPPNSRDMPPNSRDMPPNSRDMPPNSRDMPPNSRDMPPNSRDMPPSRDQYSPSPMSPPFARLTPKSSRSELRPPYSDSSAASMTSSISRANTPQTQAPHMPPASQQPGAGPGMHNHESAPFNRGHPVPNGGTLPQITPYSPPPSQDQFPLQSTRRRPLSTSPSRDAVPTGASGPNLSSEVQIPPERRRPMLSERDYSRPATSESGELRPPPLSTSRPSSASRTRTPAPAPADHMPGAFVDTPPESTTPQPVQEQLDYVAPITQDAVVNAGPSVPESATGLSTQADPEQETASDRPGLGPMIKKKAGPEGKSALASRFRTAATAYNAFKPRAGGAGERLATKNGSAIEPDGINAVVPAPLRRVGTDTESASTLVSPTNPTAPSFPAVEVTSPQRETLSEAPTGISREVRDKPDQDRVQLKDAPVEAAIPKPAAPDAPAGPPAPTEPPAAEPRRQKRRSTQQNNYLRSLDIDPRLLEGRGVEFESILTDFGWGASVTKGRSLKVMEADIKRELGRVEAGSWLGHLEQKDDRVEVVDQMLDRAIAECDELEGLLTLYAVELGSLNEDIAFIEAQSQGLQVQTANQKVLHAELSKLVDTISLTPRELQPLRSGDLATHQGLSEIEASLLLLYKALLTIDPNIRSGGSFSGADKAHELENTAIASMHALQEKRQVYMQETAGFCQRLLRHLEATFEATLQKAKPALRSSDGVGASPLKLNGPAYNRARDGLWQYSPLLLFAKEANQQAWQNSMKLYYSKARPMYTEVFRTNVEMWKKGVRKSDTSEILFTSVEKETPEGLTSTARRITVKRSQTLAKTFRTASSEKANTAEARQAQAGRLLPCEVFAGILEEQVPLLGMEQNFIVGLFHATSLENLDFTDAVMASTPGMRTGQDLTVRRLMEPDRNVARQVSDIMEELFGFWSTEMKSLMEWAVAEDPIQGVGILTSLSVQAAQLQETSQEYALHNLGALSQRLSSLFQKFVDEQIRAIEDTKVKIKKRKGVIAFMKIFPLFAATVENVYHGAAGRADGTSAVAGARQMIDEAYVRINKAMWDSLKVIAKERDTSAAAAAALGQGVDMEDKEILNYHILLIENMHHYIDTVDDGGVEGSVLAEWKGRALMDRAEHMEEYVGRVVRRPLGKMMEYVEGAETLLRQKMTGPSIAARPLYSRSSAKKMLAAHDSKEVRRGIETLRKRIEKHLGESDEEQLSRELIALVYKECERRYEKILDRLQRVCGELYKEEEKRVVIEFTKEDIRSAFKA